MVKPRNKPNQREKSMENQEKAEGENTAEVGAVPPVIEPVIEEKAEETNEPVVPPVVEEAPVVTPTEPEEVPVKDEAPAPVVAPVIEEAPVVAPVVEKATNSTDESPEISFLKDIAVSGTVVQKRILVALEKFIEALTPGRPGTPGEIVKHQNLFLDHLLWALDRNDPVEFKEIWSVLLVGFKAYHGETNSPNKGYSALSEYRAGVCSDAWADEERLSTYLNLITLLRCTRNVSTRAKDIKRIKLDAISDSLVIDSRLDNLKRFYNV